MHSLMAHKKTTTTKKPESTNIDQRIDEYHSGSDKNLIVKFTVHTGNYLSMKKGFMASALWAGKVSFFFLS